MANVAQPYGVAAHFGGEPEVPALESWAAGLRARLEAPTVTFGTVFMTPRFFRAAPEVLEIVRVHARVPVLAGCSSPGLVCGAHELEQDGGIVLALFHLPGAQVEAVAAGPGEAVRARNGEPSGWLAFTDPFRGRPEDFLAGMAGGHPGVPVAGGLAAGSGDEASVQLYLNGSVLETGTVALGFQGDVEMATLVSQGCTPIGETWTITRAHENVVATLGNRPAYEVLVETVEALPMHQRSRARGNLFAGLAWNEYAEEHGRGDFLVRNLLGADPRSGALALGARPRPGQSLRFQLRDAITAGEDLRDRLSRLRAGLAGRPVHGGVLAVCGGRGTHLFGESGHDARAVQEVLDLPALAGFFAQGEYGSAGVSETVPHVHAFTATLAVLAGR